MNAATASRPDAAPALDATTGAHVIDSIVARGDLSGLGPAERARFYVQMCEGLGLNPHAQPFAFLRLNGKEVLYATRGATDQLAAMHQVTREIIDGPRLMDLAGTPLVVCVCRASMPNGRFETSIATVPLIDPVNVMMKAETKAKRRATLSILGLGVLDECELATIPAGARAEAAEVAVDLNADLHGETSRDASGRPETSRDVPPPVVPAPSLPPAEAPVAPAVVALLAAAAEAPTPEAAVALWVSSRAALAEAGEHGRLLVKKALARRIAAVGDAGVRSLVAAEGYLRRETKRALAESVPTPAPEDRPQMVLHAEPDSEGDDEAPAPLARFHATLEEVRLPSEAVALWVRSRAALRELGPVAEARAFQALIDRTEVAGRMSGARVWLKKALAEHDAGHPAGRAESEAA